MYLFFERNGFKKKNINNQKAIIFSLLATSKQG